MDRQFRSTMGRALLPLVLVVCADAHSADPVSFATQIRPLLADRCLECHGRDTQKAGLRLDRRDHATAVLRSGKQGIAPGDPTSSELISRVTSADRGERMPPKGEPLTDRDIRQLRDWIAAGAAYEKHWSFRALAPGAPPEVRRNDWCRNDIDRYVLSRLEAARISPSPEADRYTLIRRLYYDLVGLPPSIEEVDRFTRDGSPDAYESLVDRLLGSPHFGERWGRHWLDKARYADSDGYEKDNPRPDAWRYRDWVIDAINHDVPFDEFTTQQLAGDLVPEADDTSRLATAFNRQTLTNTEGGTDREEFRIAAVMDRTETLGTVWLGLTVGCARCHSHKYDDISQEDYYRLFAFFNNADETTRKIPLSRESADKKLNVRVISERTGNPRATRVLHRGDFLQPQDEVRPEVLTALHPRVPIDARRTPDRLDLARWLTNPRNPLTPRVFVNHVWAHLFGFGIVRTMSDFGVRGEPPTHPRLLDWLAQKAIEERWSRKQLVRTIVLSQTYRQQSKYRPALDAVDPENRLLHRQNRFRVEAEVLRDITLAAGGLLSSRVGGPSVFPPIPAGITDLTYNSSFTWKTSTGEDRYRRGLYTFFKRTAPHPNLTTFDCPDSNKTNVERGRSNTPTGALTLLNNEVFVEAAQAMAKQLLKLGSGDRSRIRRAWRRSIARIPTGNEVERLERLLNRARSWYRDHPEEALKMAGAHLLDGAEPAEQASWVAVTRIVLNLDEFITRE